MHQQQLSRPHSPCREELAPLPQPGGYAEPPKISRRRADALADAGSVFEVGSAARQRTDVYGGDPRRPAGDGVLTCRATVNGRPTAIFAHEPKAWAGALGEIHGTKITSLLEYAGRARVPVVGLIDSAGARVQEGVAAMDAFGTVMRGHSLLSGRVPQISVVLGSSVGGAAYVAALSDVVIMVRGTSQMFVTGPRVIKAVTFQDVSARELGGAELHARRSGSAHLIAENEEHAFALARALLSFLPGSCWEAPPVYAVTEPDLPMPVVPADPRKTYDVRPVIRAVVDGASFLELQPRYGRNMVCALARIDGHPVGVIANQPQAMGGVLDIRACEKAARFVRMCDAFGLPLLTFVDTPGVLPSKGQEAAGVARRGAKLAQALATATVPRVSVVLRKGYGGAYVLMNSKALGADASFAWPGAEIAVMGPHGAVEVLHRARLAADPGSRGPLMAAYRDELLNPRVPAERLSVDEVITPARTRTALLSALRPLIRAAEPGYRHDNMPL
ncbi:acyl-CoA carboxylase subunit beta [Actinocorallia lasiicapitis]